VGEERGTGTFDFPQGGPPSKSRFTIPLSFSKHSSIQPTQRTENSIRTKKKADWLTKHYVTIALKYVVMFDAHHYS